MRAKEEWRNEKMCRNTMCITDKADIHKKKMREQMICLSTGCIKSKYGPLILKKEK